MATIEMPTKTISGVTLGLPMGLFGSCRSTKSRKSTKTLKDLRAEAKAYGIKGYSRMSKTELEIAVHNAVNDNSCKLGIAALKAQQEETTPAVTAQQSSSEISTENAQMGTQSVSENTATNQPAPKTKNWFDSHIAIVCSGNISKKKADALKAKVKSDFNAHFPTAQQADPENTSNRTVNFGGYPVGHEKTFEEKFAYEHECALALERYHAALEEDYHRPTKFEDCAYVPDYQENLAALDDVPEPRVLDDVQEVIHEAWQDHSCWRCEHENHSWSHEQFNRGILLSFERDNANKISHERIGLSRLLSDRYSLTQLWNLARFFALNIPKIELTGEHKILQKKQQIAGIIADEIFHMEHVFVCTYEVFNAPKLPAELEAHYPQSRKRMIEREQAIFAQRHSEQEHQPEIPAPVQEVKPKASAPKPAPVKRSSHSRKPKYDATMQITIDFDADNSQPVQNIQDAKPESTVKPYRKPRVKRDYSRQLIISFDAEIIGGKSDEKTAA